MFSVGIWIAGLLLMTVVLGRACIANSVFKYPLFYGYLIFVLFTSAYLLLVYLMWPDEYGRLYWYIEFPGAVLGGAVVWEIYRKALGRFPGAARMARNALLFVFVLVISKTLTQLSARNVGWAWSDLVELERDLRGVQAALLIGLIAVMTLYRIPLGRNLWGMMLGYGMLISANVVTLTLRAFLGERFQQAWQYIQPLSFLSALAIWCAALWSYKSVAPMMTHTKIEQDYHALVEATTKGLLEARTQLRKAFRP